MRALVTGGTGFVGGAIARELHRLGHDVAVLARPRSKTEPLEEAGITVARGDILDRDSIRRALDGRDTLFHAAAIYSLWGIDRDTLIRTEVEGTRNAFEAALAAGVDRVVYTSTSACVGEARGEVGNEETQHRGYYLSTYEEGKHQAELVARSYVERVPTVLLRPAAVLGPGDMKPTGTSIVNFLNGRFPALFRGVMTYVDIGDVVRGHLLAVEKERWGATYCLAARVMTTAEFYGLIGSMAGARKPLMVPVWVTRLFAAYEEWKARRTGSTPLISKGSLETMSHGMRVDGSKAVRELGITYTPIEESLRRAIEWYWEQGMLDRKPDCVGA